MPKYEGVYEDGRGGWYFKANFGRDPLTGKKDQVTKRGFTTATAAARARREYMEQVSSGGRPAVSASAGLTINELLDWYLDGLDADGKLSPKTRFDYRANVDAYIRRLDVGKDVLRHHSRRPDQRDQRNGVSHAII